MDDNKYMFVEKNNSFYGYLLKTRFDGILNAVFICLSILVLQGCNGGDPSNTGWGEDSTASPTLFADGISREGLLSSAGSNIITASTLWVRFSPDINPAPRDRIVGHLSRLHNNVQVMGAELDVESLPKDSVAVVIGDLNDWNKFFSSDELPTEPEAYVLKSAENDDGATIYFGMGNPGGEYNLVDGPVNIGNLYAAYALLEEFGYAFLHPLDPTPPAALTFPTELNIDESPYWPIRTIDTHVKHPLELTHVLTGWGPKGWQDLDGWQELLPEWELALEWAIANKQNRVGWPLLSAASWEDFARSEEFQRRLRVLIDMGHEWGLGIKLGVPIIQMQQHAWRMADSIENVEEQIKESVDFLAGTGVDAISTALGFTEFTSPPAEQMLDWLNIFGQYAYEQYGIEPSTGVHTSSNQTAHDLEDSEAEEPLNYNWLGALSYENISLSSHTVQMYDLEGPAYTYGNENFHGHREVMQLIAGERQVLWYPETAYWVSYDIDVPLFLPVYADRRLFDLRLIARDELEGKMGRGVHAGSRIQGQEIFSSGWEWGYWINDVVTARAAWNPLMDIADHDEALSQALNITVKPLGERAETAKALMMSWIEKQNALFIHGEVNGEKPVTPEYRAAQAYLQGWETFDDIQKTIGMLETQPRKMGMLDMHNPLLPSSKKVNYKNELRPLLRETAESLRETFTEFAALESNIPATGRTIYDEIKDGMEITTLRAEQVYNLYEVAHRTRQCLPFGDMAVASKHLSKARSALDRAQEVVFNREQSYRVDPERIAGWHYNPTVYHFGYLWTARSLHYWWRDELKAVDCPASPHVMNIIDFLDTVAGEGDWIEYGINISAIVRAFRRLVPKDSWLGELIQEPSREPFYPEDLDGLRDRPEWLH